MKEASSPPEFTGVRPASLPSRYGYVTEFSWEDNGNWNPTGYLSLVRNAESGCGQHGAFHSQDHPQENLRGNSQHSPAFCHPDTAPGGTLEVTGQRQDGLPQAGPHTTTRNGSFTCTAAMPIGLLCEPEINYFVKTLIFQDFIALAASVSFLIHVTYVLLCLAMYKCIFFYFVENNMSVYIH